MNGPMYPFGRAQVVPFFRRLRARIIATVALLAGGLAWVVLYLAFLAGHFTWYQNFAVVLVSLISVPTIVVAIWVSWGLSMGHRLHRAFWFDEFP